MNVDGSSTIAQALYFLVIPFLGFTHPRVLAVALRYPQTRDKFKSYEVFDRIGERSLEVIEVCQIAHLVGLEEGTSRTGEPELYWVTINDVPVATKYRMPAQITWE